MGHTVGIIIDYANLCCGVGGVYVDLGKLIDFLRGDEVVTQKNIYLHNNVPEKFIEYLEYNHYRVVKKEKKRLSNGTNKCNFDVEIAMDVMEMIADGTLPDILVLVSGDSDFVGLVRRVQQEGTSVVVVAAFQFLATELKEMANGYIYIDDNLLSKIERL